jgi:hypothetical protein
MNRMVVPRSSLLVAVVAAGAMAAGCGSGGSGTAPANTGSRPAAAPTGVGADPAAVRVIRAWSDSLRHGDVRGAARYFALPSAFINGVAITIHTENQATAANASLPCGAVLISAHKRGRYVNALFRLTDRPGPGGGCGSGVGQLARTNFVIAGGRIVAWIRAPENPGGGSGPGASPEPAPPAPAPPAPTTPRTPQGAGPVV